MTQENDELPLAAGLLWKKILNAEYAAFFAHESKYMRMTGHEMDRLAQPGFVGSNYRRGGLLLIGQNPGNDRVPHGILSPADREQFDLLTSFAGCAQPEVGSQFEAIMRALQTTVMPKWAIYRNVVDPLLAALQLSLDQIAYINLMKYHTSGSDLPMSLYGKAWLETAAQIKLLQPGVIVCLGVGTLSKFQNLQRLSGNAEYRLHKVERARGDTRLPPGGARDIAHIACLEREAMNAIYSDAR